MYVVLSDKTARRWRPSAFIRASAAWHGVALLATLARPALWHWTLGTVLADHLVLSTVGLWPRSTLLGPNWTRLPRNAQERGLVALTFDDGPDPEITPRVLAILDEHSVKATFFCIGDRVRQYPALAREIVRRGHDLENHSQRHTHTFSLLGRRGMSQEIERAQQTIIDVSGREPRFFRAPAGLRSPFLDPVLARVGLRLVSWTRRGYDTVNRSADDVLAKLTHRLGAGDILLLHDGSAARTADGEPIVLAVLPRLLAVIARQGLTPVTLGATLT
jgi:peptidoglycan/xylan/chitin deacetylase (PgdA/CDA1 family)